MGFLLNLFGTLFGSTKALNRTVSTAADAIDKFVYTDKEKEEDAAKERAEARQMVVKWIDNTSGQNLTRRLLALSISFVWLSQFVLYQIFNIIYIFNPTLSQLHQAALSLEEGGQSLSTSVTIIITFYFAAPHIADIISKVKKN